jgi:fibronectin-binding autotransporter adhesin
MELRVRYSLGLLLLGLVLTPSPSYAAIVQTGNVIPNVNTWNSSTYGYIGNSSDGSVLVDAGSILNSYQAILGYNFGSTGSATVTGVGSQWANTSLLRVGYGGNGSLTIEAGGRVSNDVGQLRGTATVTGVGSKWTNTSVLSVGIPGASGTLTVSDGGEVVAGDLYASLSDLFGNSKITATKGAVLDADLLFDAAHGNQATVSFGAGGTLTVIVADGTLGVGFNQSGSLTMADGVNISSHFGCLGCNAGTTGTATVTGTGSKWTNTGVLSVGVFDSSGTLTVVDEGEVVTGTLAASLSDLFGDGKIRTTQGAVVDADLLFNAASGNRTTVSFGSGGSLIVEANGGALGVGYKQSGSLAITEGVNIYSTRGHVAYGIGTTGTATITGAGTTWTIGGALSAGAENSTGTLTIADGAQVSNTNGSLASIKGSSVTATVTGVGSKWTNNGSLNVGDSGNGSLTIEAGGQVSNSIGYLGRSSGATGKATVTGVGSKWTNDGSLNVGYNGNGSLTIEAGGQVSNDLGGYLGFGSSFSTATAMVTGVGSRWTNSTLLYVGDKGSGTLGITSGGLVSVRGGLRIDTDLDGDSFINMATGGMLALLADVDDSLGQFLDRISGTDAIRYWNTAMLQWSPLTAATFGIDYTLSYITTGDLTGYTLLTVGSASAVGDYDGDGDVDGRDFLILQRNSGLGSVSDWQNAYGNSDLTASSTSVPEPSAFVLAIALAAASSFTRRRNFAC